MLLFELLGGDIARAYVRANPSRDECLAVAPKRVRLLAIEFEQMGEAGESVGVPRIELERLFEVGAAPRLDQPPRFD